MPHMVTFTINIPQMSAYIPYMDPMGMKPPLLSTFGKRMQHFFCESTIPIPRDHIYPLYPCFGCLNHQ